jgi:hypothetical protein
MLDNVDIATILYSYFFLGAGVLAALSYIARSIIKNHTEGIREDLGKIMYALYNDGQTGLINKVDHLIEKQQEIKIDVEVLKAKSE